MAVSGIEIENLTFAYANEDLQLAGVSFAVREAEVCCLLGPNGTGKTTLLKCILGLLKPRSGVVRLCRQDTRELSPRQLARLVAYVPQYLTTPFSFTALDIAVMGRTPYLSTYSSPSNKDRTLALSAMERLGITHLAEHAFSTLSGGERQLTLLARALVQESLVLILDEPTASLDFGNEVRLLQVVSELASTGKTILMTTHQPAHALGYAHRAVLLDDGRVIADGRPNDVVTTELLSNLYGVDIHVVDVDLPSNSRRSVRTCLHFSSPPHDQPSQ